MPDPLSSSILAANPTLSIDPERYSSFDGNSDINRFVQQLRFFLPWKYINGQILEVRGHNPNSDVIADFYDHENLDSVTTTVPITSTAYEFASPSSSGSPTQQFSLKEITALVDMRMLSQQLLSREFNQTRFQKRALKHAVCSRLESGLINGSLTTSTAQFDGVSSLVTRGMGQRLNATPNSGLEILDEAMTRIRSHNRRVSLIVMNQDAWRRLLQLQRNHGYAPRFGYSKRLRQRISFYNEVPVCLSDHIATDSVAGGRGASVFLMSFGKNGVWGLLSRKRPRVYFTQTSQPNSPFQAYQAHLFCGLASMTSDALVEVANWNVTLDN